MDGIGDKYLEYLRINMGSTTTCECEKTSKGTLSVGIVGAGISGLYSALLLQHYIPNVKVKIFEASNRVGGRIYTHKFSEEPYQYCEAGAMRFPSIPSQAPVFQLIDYLNKLIPTSPLKLIDFIMSCPSGNRVLVNNTKMKDGRVMTTEYASSHCSELGFSTRANIGDMDQAFKLLLSALEPVILDFKENFKDAMIKYRYMSLHQYLVTVAGWTEERVCYCEVMTSGTNETHLGLIFFFMNYIPPFLGASSWKTIEGGMSALPEYSAEVIRKRGGKILLSTKVESISHPDECGMVTLGFRNLAKESLELEYEDFDAVIMATPTSNIRILKERPHWPDSMEHALSSLLQIPMMKICLRFKSRFWESLNLQHPPSLGGISNTDLSIRRIFYPSYGIGDRGMGILMSYILLEEARHLVSLTDKEKIQIMLRDLQILYPEVDIANEYAGGCDTDSDLFLKEAYVADWASQWSMGAAFSPGQFEHVYPILAQNRGNIYFAGDHLSTNTVFIAGALESTRFAVQQLIQRQVNQELLIHHLKAEE